MSNILDPLFSATSYNGETQIRTHRRSRSLEMGQSYGRRWDIPCNIDLLTTTFPSIKDKILLFEPQETESEVETRQRSLTDISKEKKVHPIKMVAKKKLCPFPTLTGEKELNDSSPKNLEDSTKSPRRRATDSKDLGIQSYFNPMNTRRLEVNASRSRSFISNKDKFTIPKYDEKRNLKSFFKSSYLTSNEQLLQELENIRRNSREPSNATLTRRRAAVLRSEVQLDHYKAGVVSDEKIFKFFHEISFLGDGDFKDIAPEIVKQILKLDNPLHLFCELLRRSAALCDKNALFQLDTCGFTIYIAYLLQSYEECIGLYIFDEIALKATAHHLKENGQKKKEKQEDLVTIYFKLLEQFFRDNQKKIEKLKRKELNKVTLLNDYFVALLYENISKSRQNETSQQDDDVEIAKQDEAAKLAIAAIFLRCLLPNISLISYELEKSARGVILKQAEALKRLAYEALKRVNNLDKISEIDKNSLASLANLFFCNDDNTRSSSEVFLNEILKLKGINLLHN